MRRLVPAIIVTALLASSVPVSFCIADNFSDDDIKAKIVAGPWHNKEEFPNGSSERTYAFYPDNTFWKRGTIRKGEEVIEIDYRGKYAIENGLITETVTSSNRPDIIPMRGTTTDRIINITEHDFIYESRGKEVHFKRIDDTPTASSPGR